ncbi:MAG: glycine zipper 2TM domain-containing protein [Oxalobacteraceae bacterium]|nr:glycine zipper 2TM domain-containing protein [Oxalobacteraceae bacterium]
MNTKNYASTLPCLILALLSGLPLLAYAQAQEIARVLSSTPVVTQVSQPRQVCGETQVITAAPKSGAGALMGAIAGGAIGNSIGGGSGRALATAAGVIGGAIFGDSIEAAPAPVRQQMTSCTTQISYENRVTAYNVVYEYGGKQYSIQLPNDPGPYLPVNVTPAILAAPPAPSTTITTAPPIVTTPSYVTPTYVTPTYVTPMYVAPMYTQPMYAAPLYRTPRFSTPGVSFHFGHHGHRHGHHHDHWRWQ